MGGEPHGWKDTREYAVQPSQDAEAADREADAEDRPGEEVLDVGNESRFAVPPPALTHAVSRPRTKAWAEPRSIPRTDCPQSGRGLLPLRVGRGRVCLAARPRFHHQSGIEVGDQER